MRSLCPARVGSPRSLGIETEIASFRPAQEAALAWIERSHKRFLLLDAPTGSGKSLIGRAAGAILERPAAYLATDKGLQRQFTSAFGDSAELMGRGNYRRPEWLEDITCEDCTWSRAGGCSWCGADRDGCPYQVAKRDALEAPFAVLNTAYFMTEANHGGAFSREDQLVVIDEADTLEGEVLRHVAVSVDDHSLLEMGGLDEPSPGTEPGWALEAWNRARGIASDRRRQVDALRAQEDAVKPRVLAQAQRQAERSTGLARRLGALAEDLAEDPGSWVRKKAQAPQRGAQRPPVEFDPVYVRKYAAGRLWRHGGRFLLMSATLLAPEVLTKELGIPSGEWDYLQLDSDFPAERRPVFFRPVASMAFRHREISLPLIVAELDGLLDRYPGRVLVHSQTFSIGRQVVARSRHWGRFVLYEGGGRDDGVERYKARPDAVLIGPSVKRGVDLPDGLCDAVVILVVPKGDWGDARVRARVHAPGGQDWYDAESVRQICQMTGRGMRHPDDRCESYILDSEFARLWRRRREMFPGWWQEALVDERRLVGGGWS